MTWPSSPSDDVLWVCCCATFGRNQYYRERGCVIYDTIKRTCVSHMVISRYYEITPKFTKLAAKCLLSFVKNLITKPKLVNLIDTQVQGYTPGNPQCSIHIFNVQLNY